MSGTRTKAMRRFLFAFIPSLLLLVLVYFFALAPQMEAKEEALARLSAAKSEAERLEVLVGTLPHLRDRHSALSNLMPDIRQAITFNPETAELLAQVNGFCIERGATLMSFTATPPASEDNEDALMEVGLNAVITGTYQEVHGVLTDIQSWGRLITVDDLAISSDDGDPPTVTVGLRMKAFVFGGEGG